MKAENEMVIIGMHISVINFGKFIGKRALYIYFSKCNRYCNYCTYKEDFFKMCKIGSGFYPRFTIQEIVNIVNEFGLKYVVLSGGEPALEKHLKSLILKLQDNANHVIVETNAKYYYDVLEYADSVTISLKTYSAGTPYANKNIIDKYLKRCSDVTLTCLIKDSKDFDNLGKFNDYDVWLFLEFDDNDFSGYTYRFMTNDNWRMVIRQDRVLNVDYHNSYKRAKKEVENEN